MTAAAAEAHSRLVVVSRAIVEKNESANRVLCFREGSDYTVLDQAMADQDPAEVDERDLIVVCIDCLLGVQPSLGRGLDLAKRAGAARYWQGSGSRSYELPLLLNLSGAAPERLSVQASRGQALPLEPRPTHPWHRAVEGSEGGCTPA